ncbi:MAG TPA: hypothetical protein VNQ79_03715 [Blastocatellia bacterium]|nr:hypothetical protein [Blastocatellia bacterium]
MRNRGSINSAAGSASRVRRHALRAALPTRAWPVPVKANDQAIISLQVSTLTIKKRYHIVGGKS